MHAFQLGREYKLSLAEIHACFPTLKIEYVDMNVCIFSGVDIDEVLKKLPSMGGVVKCMELIPNYRGNPAHSIIDIAETHQGKFRYGLSCIGETKNLKATLLDIKRFLQKKDISSRFINKDFKNLNTAQIQSEDLVKRGSDFTIISCSTQNLTLNPSPQRRGKEEVVEYFGKTIWIQDIDAYSARDYGKTRDMQVGMLPPKLAQMMINFALTPTLSQREREQAAIYDPFCGLGTVLIESIINGNAEMYGSDISAENIEKTKQNINFARKNFTNSVKTADAFVLDARGISSSPVLKKSDVIVTEGYLGQVFQKFSVTEKKIAMEKKQLLDIYDKFFFGLTKANFQGNIVISFPFWEIRGKYFYFSEIYDIIKMYCKILPLLPRLDEVRHTRSGSLLYKRPDQVVGREIFKLKIRK